MDEKKELEGLEKGDNVWSPIYGECEIKEVEADGDFDISGWNTGPDGIRTNLNDKHPAFFRNEESFRRYWELEYTGDGDDSKAPPKEEFSIDPEIVKDLMDATDSIQEEAQKMMIAAKAFRCAGEHLTGDLVDEFSHRVDSHRYNLHKEIRKLKEEDKDESN